MSQDEKKENRNEIKSLNDPLLEELSIEELEKRLELTTPKTCGQYTPASPEEAI
jgi:hypothetical protein